ncbi:DUF885 domain-containing protein [Sphingomonas sp. KRR8]|uniref:DUF885 domain-containing protein n=1 Tax=Sphingomonas sp. KRR8 TaxID=2942996 RepID=UPI0020219A4B|nr:DUF885 domain-containing protein [Sphingomonas sp. KRR8]URD60916.1 DUF885 domain-containing protein [Sphingomonas sp. KRR8]
MRKFAAALALGAASIGLTGAVAPARSVAVSEDARFTSFSNRVVDQFLRLNPIYATTLGDHRFDGQMTDVSEAGREAQRRFAQAAKAELARFDPAKLSREHQVDAILLRDQLDYALFSDGRLQDWAWDPLTYTGPAGTALFGLSSRQFAPLPVRLRSATQRLEALPRFLAQMRQALVPARVPRIHVETAAKQNAGLASLVDDIIKQQAALPGPERARLVRAGAAAKAAIAAQQGWFDKTLIPQAKGNERIGAALYDEKLRLALNSTLSRQEIRARAEAEIARLRAEMYTVAAGMLRGHAGAPPAPPNPTPDQQQAVIQAGLAIVTADVPAKDQVIPFTKGTLQEAIAFAKAKDLISFPTQSFNVIEMPEYARGVAAAYADMPGAFEKDQRGYYAVTPIPPEWTPAQAASFLREYNKWTLHELTLHEGVPGHLLQLAHANQYKSRLRALLQSGSMVEGWACYSQDVMADAGFLNRDPRYLLAHYKFAMRPPVNAILDQDFHTGNMTREAAMTLMTRTAFQEEREAAGKWVRMQLSSAQLPTYWVGYSEWKDFRAAAEQRPGFNLKRFHDAALSHGSPPVRFIRQLTFGEPIR